MTIEESILQVLDKTTELGELKKQEIASEIARLFGVDARSYFVAHPMGEDWEQLSISTDLSTALHFYRNIVNKVNHPYPRILAELNI